METKAAQMMFESQRLLLVIQDTLRMFRETWTVLMDLTTVQVRLDKAGWWKLSGRGTETPCYTIGNAIYFAPEVLNKTGYHYGNTLDLATPAGFATLAHEIFHVYQYRRDGRLKSAALYLKGIISSLFKGKLYDHASFVNEVEALATEKKMREFFALNTHLLQIFNKLR